MNNIEIQRFLIELLRSQEYSIGFEYVELNYSEDIESKCNDYSLQSEKIGDRIRIIIPSKICTIFTDIESFLEKASNFNTQSSYIVLDGKRTISFSENLTYIDQVVQESYFFFNNVKAYNDFLKLLKEVEKEQDDGFHFVDSYSQDLRKLSLVSLSERGRLQISYSLKTPLFDSSKDYRLGFDKFKECFISNDKTLLRFLKSATIDCASKFDCDIRMQKLFESLNDVVEKAKINFEVYLNNLSIDRIRREYDDVKTKYFQNLSDILSKLTEKIIGLPIVISASVIAVVNMKDNNLLLIFLGISLIVTSAYISLLLKVHFKDLFYISKSFRKDYLLITENKFFAKYPEEKLAFAEIEARINERVIFLGNVIESYYWVMNCANIFILSFIAFKCSVSINSIVLINAFVLYLLICFRNYVVSDRSLL